VTALDIFATIAGPAGVTPDPDRPLDGVDLLPHLAGTKSGAPHEALYLRMYDKGAYVLRSGDLKLLIEAKGRKPELYHHAGGTRTSGKIAPHLVRGTCSPGIRGAVCETEAPRQEMTCQITGRNRPTVDAMQT
jgi:hypothetical protein